MKTEKFSGEEKDDSVQPMLPITLISGRRLVKPRSSSPSKSLRTRRKREPATSLRLSLQFLIPTRVRSGFSRDWIVRVSAKAVLLYTIFSRGVIPTSPLELVNVYEEYVATPRILNPRDRKAIKCGESLCRLLMDWDKVTAMGALAFEIQGVLISMGPHWSRLKEHYFLKLPALLEDISCDFPEPTNRQEHMLSRRIVSELLNATNVNEHQTFANAMAHPSLGASSYNVFLSFWIPTDAINRIFSQRDNATRDGESLSVPDIFGRLTMRHGFSTQQVARASLQSQTMIMEMNVTSPVTHPADGSLWDESRGVWLSFSSSVKGYRL
jgi:hypothetical protein